MYLGTYQQAGPAGDAGRVIFFKINTVGLPVASWRCAVRAARMTPVHVLQY
eukprot:SAG31_NODE_42500_length_271_cov_0.883721_1_plen_51_part_10